MANAAGKAGTVAATVNGTDSAAVEGVDARRDVRTAPAPSAELAAAVDHAVPSDAIDPVIEALLAQLWEAANDRSGKIWSLAKLSKRSQIPQSSMRRHLTSLTEAGLVTVTLDETGLGSSTLTEFGRSVCMDLFGALGTATP
jgi:DNA-binding transcriptional ArsR family regulator